MKASKSKRVIVRSHSAGVFFGELTKRSKDGLRGVVKNARRLWYWSGAASLSQLAVDGVVDPSNCKFPCAVEEIELTQIKVTAKVEKSIDGVPVWSR